MNTLVTSRPHARHLWLSGSQNKIKNCNAFFERFGISLAFKLLLYNHNSLQYQIRVIYFFWLHYQAELRALSEGLKFALDLIKSIAVLLSFSHQHAARWSLGQARWAKIVLRRHVAVQNAALFAQNGHVCNDINRRDITRDNANAMKITVSYATDGI